MRVSTSASQEAAGNNPRTYHDIAAACCSFKDNENLENRCRRCSRRRRRRRRHPRERDQIRIPKLKLAA